MPASVSLSRDIEEIYHNLWRADVRRDRDPSLALRHHRIVTCLVWALSGSSALAEAYLLSKRVTDLGTTVEDYSLSPDNSVVQAPEPGVTFRSHLGSTRWAPIRKTEVRVGHRKCQECFASAALFVGCSQNMRVSVSGDVLMLLTPQSYWFFDTFVNVGVSAVSRNPLRKFG